jgi:hypothetical protein
VTLLNAIGASGLAGVALALVVLGLLSRRLGKATRTTRHYIGFFFAAELLFVSAAAQLANLLFQFASVDDLATSFFWVFLYSGLPAIGVTIGLFFAWHYWSWLLAERD